jgi:Tol biopolymer transport system component
VVLALALGGCGGASEPTTPPPATTPPPSTTTPPATPPPATRPLAFIAGGGVVDTIDAANRVRLTIKALDNSGAPLAGLPVDLRIRPRPSNLQFGEAGSVADRSLTTDSVGLASTELRFGAIAGTWYVVALDMRRGAADSVAFTVKAGAPASMKILPRDTLSFVGGGYQLAVSTTDRRGNAVNAALTYAADSVAGVASITTAGRVTGMAVGRSRFLVRISGSQTVDTARVTVVPPGKLAAVSSGGLSVINLDGSDFRLLVPGTGSYFFPSWSPDGTGVVYNSDSPATGLLYRVDLQGKITLLSTGTTMRSETWPRYSPDGQFIYFSGGYYPDSIDTYRMRADGTGARVRVTPLRPGSTRYWKASPSPDGSLLAYSEAGFRLRVVNLTTGADRIIPTPGWAEAPRFSPSGEWIAYADDFLHAIQVIRVDGTGYRVLTPSSTWVDEWGHDWSPDGEWIVFSRSGGLSIVRVSDGLILPLNYSRSLYAASWHQ